MSYAVDDEGRVYRESDDVVHLASVVAYGELTAWCGAPDSWADVTVPVTAVTCHACLQAAGAHGMSAMRRLDALLAIEDPDDDTAPRCSCEREGSCRYCATESIVAVTGGVRREDFLR